MKTRATLAEARNAKTLVIAHNVERSKQRTTEKLESQTVHAEMLTQKINELEKEKLDMAEENKQIRA